jgi:hypothetical protein
MPDRGDFGDLRKRVGDDTILDQPHVSDGKSDGNQRDMRADFCGESEVAEHPVTGGYRLSEGVREVHHLPLAQLVLCERRKPERVIPEHNKLLNARPNVSL